MTSSLLTYGTSGHPVGLSIYVDGYIPVPPYTPVGSVDRPFVSVQDAVNYAISRNLFAAFIKISPNNYTNMPITLTQNIEWTLEGAVDGTCLLGDITWSTSGDRNPLVPQSGLVLRNCAPSNITINDGTTPAVFSLLIMENSAVLGNIVATGTSNVVVLLSGISTAASSIAEQNVSSLITGNISVPHSAIGLTNTQVDGYVDGYKVWLSGCQIFGAITSTTACDIIQTLLGGTITAPSGLSLDDFSFNQVQTKNISTFPYLMTPQFLSANTPFTNNSQTIILDDLTAVILTPRQYNTKYLIFTSNGAKLTNNINIAIPQGAWLFDCSQVVFNGKHLNFVNGANSSTNITNAANVGTVFATSAGVNVVHN